MLFEWMKAKADDSTKAIHKDEYDRGQTVIGH